jgi:elongation factor 1-alpha
MFEFINRTIPKQRREMNTGNREYKIHLGLYNDETKTEQKKNKYKPEKELQYQQEQKLLAKINKRASQLKYRLEEGHGNAIYMIGIKDDGTIEGNEINKLFESINFIWKMVEILNVKIKKIRIYLGNKPNTYIAIIRIYNPNYKPKQLLFI